MANEAVPLHFPKPETTIPGLSLRGLPRERSGGAPRAGMHLVQNHVFELLVIYRSHEDVALHWLSSDAAVENVPAVVIKAVPHQTLPAAKHTVATKRGPVLLATLQHPSLPGNQLDHFPHRHPRREPVGVHDQVRAHALIVERHVRLGHNQPHHPFLAVAAAKLVTQLGPPGLTNVNLYHPLLLLVCRDQHLVHHRGHRPFVGQPGRFDGGAPIFRSARDVTVDQHVPIPHGHPRGHQPVWVQVAELRIHPGAVRRGRQKPVKGLLRVLLHICDEFLHYHAASVAAVDGRLIVNGCILNVVAGVAHHGDGGVDPRRELLEARDVNDVGLHQGLLGVGQEVQHSVDAVELVVRHGAHRLLPHCTLVGVPRGLVVVRVRDQPSDHSQQGEGLDLQMSGLGLQFGLPQSDKRVVFLIHIQVLHCTFTQKVLEVSSPLGELPKMDVLHGGDPVSDHNQRTAHSATIGGDVHAAVRSVEVHRRVRRDPARPPQRPELADKLRWVAMNPSDQPVDRDDRVKLNVLSEDHRKIFHPKVQAQPQHRLRVQVGGDQTHQGEILDQPAGLPLWGVRGAQHAPG
eukprot:RCo046838